MPRAAAPPAPPPASAAPAPPDHGPVAGAGAEALAIALRHLPADGVHRCAVPGLHLIRASAPGQPLPAVYEPGLVLVLQGRKQAVLGDLTLRYDPLHCLLVSVTALPQAQVLQASAAAPYVCVRLGIDAPALAALVLDAGAARPMVVAPPGNLPPSLNLAPVTPDLLDAVCRLLRLLDAPQDVPVLAPLLQREIFYRVLTGSLGPRLRALAVADSQAQRIGRAIDLLQRHFDRPLRIDDLAAAAHMSASALHLHFKHCTALTPLQYQKQLRLQRARQLMLAEAADAAEAAYRVGYESPSQFSRDYRRLFGAPPRSDVQRLRQQQQAAGAL